MFRAMGRYLKALGFLITGNIDKARQSLNRNPAVVRATYAEIVREKSGRIREYTEAVAGLVTQEEKKKAQLKQLTDEVKRLEDLKSGALAKAKKKAAELQAAGMPIDEVQKDADYLRCKSAFTDFTSTLNEKQERINELEADVASYGEKIAKHKVQLQQLLRELDKVKAEADEAVADMVTAQEEKEIGQMLTGISEDGTAQQLQEMRELRNKAKAEARIASEMAGLDTRAEEAEFLEYARSSEANSEFDALIGLAEKAGSSHVAAKSVDNKEQLPQ